MSIDELPEGWQRHFREAQETLPGFPEMRQDVYSDVIRWERKRRIRAEKSAQSAWLIAMGATAMATLLAAYMVWEAVSR